MVCTDFLTRCRRLISISDRDINYLHVYTSCLSQQGICISRNNNYQHSETTFNGNEKSSPVVKSGPPNSQSVGREAKY